MTMTTAAAAAAAAAAMERLCSGVIRAIKSAGAELPSAAVDDDDGPPPSSSVNGGSVCWVEYASSCGREVAVISELRRHVGSLRAEFGPTFDAATAVGADGRPLLYAACFGLMLSDRRVTTSNENTSKTATPLSVFLATLWFLTEEVGTPVDQPTFKRGACHRLPIHLLARACYPSAVLCMLECGADPSGTDDEGWTALMACCMGADQGVEEGAPTVEERVETARVLLDYQLADDDSCVNVDDANFRRYTALHLACEGLMAPLVKLLLDRGADPTSRTVYGESPLGLVLWNEERDPAAAELCREYLLAAIDKNGECAQYQDYYREEMTTSKLVKLMDNVLIPVAQGDVVVDELKDHVFRDEGDRREHCLLVTIMKYVGMDLGLLQSQGQGQLDQHHARTKVTNGHGTNANNWYEELHRRVYALLPKAYLKVYRANDQPTDDEVDIITSRDGNAQEEAEFRLDDPTPGARRVDVDVLRTTALMRFRQRGRVAYLMDNFTKLVINPIQHGIAFAVPSDAVLDRIAHHAPRIVEIGAGTGYWSSVLRQRNVDVVAYDADPPTPSDDTTNGGPNGKGKGHNWFASRTFTTVLKGSGEEVFRGEEGARLASERAMLIVWPNNPDHVDNPHIRADEEENTTAKLPELPVWDANCLAAYVKGGGTTVIYVGEREERIELEPDATGPDCGFCSSRRFQQMLREEFVLVEQLECPTWCFKDDDVTIWKRR